MKPGYLGAVLLLFIILPLAFAEGITKEDALNAIQQAEQDLQQMIEDGFSVTLINDTLTLAKQALQRADFAILLKEKAAGELAEMAKKSLEGLDYQGFTYDEVLKHTKELTSIKEQAYATLDSITALELKIKDFKGNSVDTAEAEAILGEAGAAFDHERYDEAEAMLANAHSNLEDKKAELAKVNVVVASGKTFVEKNWKGLLVFAAVVVVVVLFSWKKIKVKKLRKSIKRLESEQVALVKLLKKAQTERYKEGKISGFVYNVRTERYNKKLDEIKEVLPSLKAMLEKSRKKKAGKAEKPEKVEVKKK